MQPLDFAQKIIELHADEESATILASLRVDPLVWESLQDADWVSKILEDPAVKELWNPGSLAMMKLGNPIPPDQLRATPLQPLAPELRQSAARAYENTIQTGQAPSSLGAAGLLALALRENWRLTESWSGILDELNIHTAANPDPEVAIWQTPLACLYSMGPEQKQLLGEIFPAASDPASNHRIHLVTHILLANPIPFEERISMFSELLQPLLPADRLDCLKTLQKSGYGKLASEIARQLSGAEDTPMQPAGKTTWDVSNPAFTLHSTGDMAEVAQKAGLEMIAQDAEGALQSIESGHQKLIQNQAYLTAIRANMAQHRSDPAEALTLWESAYNLWPDSSAIQSGYGQILITAGRYEDAANILDRKSLHPATLAGLARINAHSGNLLVAQEYARKAALTYLEFYTMPANPAGLPFDETRSFLIDTLSSLDMHAENIVLLRELIQKCPNDCNLLSHLSRAYQSVGNLPEATRQASLLSALCPADQPSRRLLIGLYEQAENWSKALSERLRLIHNCTNPEIEDLLNIAVCSLKAGQPEQVIVTCKAILKMDGNNGLAHAYMGEALAITGDQQEAYNHFTQATLLAPDRPEPWLMLARSLQRNGDDQKALETLRAGSQASTTSAEILMALGEMYLDQQSPADALPAFRKAAGLAPKNPQITFDLCDTLRSLGHLIEAKQTIEKARQQWPAQAGLAFLHGKILLEQNEPANALAALATSIQNGKPTNEAYYIYANALMTLANQVENESLDLAQPLHPNITTKTAQYLDQAEQAIHTALDLKPDHRESRLLLAEILTSKRDFQAAQTILQELVNTDHEADPALAWRINLDMGRVNLGLGEIDSALVLLQETTHAHPQDLVAQQTLTEIYLTSQLAAETLQTARNAREIAPHNVANLCWFTRITYLLGNYPETIETLNRAAQLAPDRSDLLIQLAFVQITSGQIEEAHQSLLSVLQSTCANPTELHRAASILSTLDDLNSAAACLSRIIQENTPPNLSVLVELVKIYIKMGQFEDALKHIAHAIEIKPEDPELYVLQSDIFASLNRNQEAFACLEQALNINRNHGGVFPEEKIHLRLAHLQQKIGDLVGALQQAEMAHQASPENIDGIALIAELACALIHTDRLVEILTQASTLLEACEYPELDPEMQSAGTPAEAGDENRIAFLLTLIAEAQLNNRQDQGAELTLQRLQSILPNNPETLALMARIDLHNGDRRKALSEYGEAIHYYSDGAAILPYCARIVADAGFELTQWDSALDLLARSAEESKINPSAHLNLARGVIINAENQSTYRLLQVTEHAPGEEKLTEKYFQVFKKAILTANRASNSPEIIRWHNRGQAVYNLEAHQLTILAENLLDGNDAAALIAGYRRFGAADKAMEIAGKYTADAQVMMQTALLQMDQNPTAAYETAIQLVEACPHQPIYQMLAAMTAKGVGDFNSSLQYIKEALAFWPEEHLWHVFAGQLLTELGKTAEAVDHWQRAATLQPDNPEYVLALGKLHTSMGNSSMAIQTLEQAVRIAPANVESWLSLAKAYESRRDSQKAIRCAEQAIQLAPREIDPLLVAGELEFQAKEYKNALQYAQMASDLDPASSAGVILAVHSMEEMQQEKEALSWIDHKLPGLVDPLPILLEKARLTHSINGPQAALEILDHLAFQNPKSVPVLNRLAGVLAEMGKKEPAQQVAQESLKIDPEQYSVHLLLGRIKRMDGHLDQSIYHLTAAISLAPKEVEPYLELGRVYQDRREYAQAINTYQQAISIASQDHRAYYQAGLILRETKDYITAESMLRQAVELAPNDLTIRRQLGAMIAINLVHNPQEVSV